MTTDFNINCNYETRKLACVIRIIYCIFNVIIIVELLLLNCIYLCELEVFLLYCIIILYCIIYFNVLFRALIITIQQYVLTNFIFNICIKNNIAVFKIEYL